MSVDLSPAPLPHKKTEGIRHVLAAASFSFAGFRRMLRETAFRHELLAAAAMLCALVLAGVQANDYIIQGGLMLMLLAVEALNTAIEQIVDRVSPELSVFAKEAKDLGSFAVFCLISANALFAMFALYRAI